MVHPNALRFKEQPGLALSGLLCAVSESIIQPSLNESPSTGIREAATEPSTPRPRRRLLLVVAAVAMLVGALAASTVFLVVGHQHQYDVNVYLNQDVTAEQKAAIESALDALQPVEGIRVESREQAFQRLQELFKDNPDMVGKFSADALPDSFRLTTNGREFDCARLVPIWRLPGVNEIQVIQVPTKGNAPATVGCGPVARPSASA